jgi:hypothetical protein
MSANERQAAAADARARRAAAPAAEPEESDNLALQALTLANEQGEAADVTVARAEQYLKFLKENI